MLFMDANIIVVKVDEGGFLMVSKKMILAIIVDPLKRLHRVIVEVRGAQISIADIATFQVLLQQQVVGCGDVVVLVGLDAPLGVLDVEVELR